MNIKKAVLLHAKISIVDNIKNLFVLILTLILFLDKTESVQYNAALAITRPIKGQKTLSRIWSLSYLNSTIP